MHNALKLEKSAISKVQKSISCNFKNGKKSIFAPEKMFKIMYVYILHSALKLEKSAKKALFALSKMAKNQFLNKKKV